jgi:hypothetical protein
VVINNLSSSLPHRIAALVVLAQAEHLVRAEDPNALPRDSFFAIEGMNVVAMMTRAHATVAILSAFMPSQSLLSSQPSNRRRSKRPRRKRTSAG